MKSIEISVVVPVYNVKNYIGDSVESVCRQDFKEFELILVDDSSPDESIDIAEKILKKYPNVDYKVIHKENGGLPSARNAGLKVAIGKYVCFVDSDDVIEQDHLRKLYELNENEKLNLSYTDFEFTYENNRYGTPCLNNDVEIIPRNELLNGFLRRNLKIHCCSILFRREYLLENNLFFNELLRYGEDIEFMWRVFPMLDAVGHVKSYTYKYLQRPNSIMSSQSNDKVIILCNEFKKVSQKNIEQYPNDNSVFKFLVGKGYLAFFRTAAETSEYKIFKDLLKKVNYREEIKKLFSFDHPILRLLAIVLYLNPFLFYCIVKIYKKKRVVSYS